MPSFGRIAAAAAGGIGRGARGFMSGGDAFEQGRRGELEFHSKLAQALGQIEASKARTDLNAAKAEAERADLAARSPERLRDNALLAYGVPVGEGAAVDSYLRTGQLGGKYAPGPDGMGPVEPQPQWAGPGPALPGLQPTGVVPGYENKLGDVARRIASVQEAIALGDKSSKNVAEARSVDRNTALSDAIIAGTANRNTVAGAQAASGAAKVDPLFSTDSTGSVLDRYGGQLNTANPLAQSTIGLRTEQANAQRANAGQSAAQADAATALAEQRRKVTAAGPGAGKAPAHYRYVTTDDGEIVLEPIPGGKADPSKAPPPKPMPSAALKLQQEELDAIAMASTIDADLGALQQQITDKKLQLGLISNLLNKGRNFAGMSDEQSRNLATFQATLEKMRNDSLRLNKGVQTEGDAVRAWNELVTNINDPGVVQQRLAEIRAINRRAADLRKLNVETIRANFGHPPLDVSGHTNVQPAIGGGTPAAPAPSPAAQETAPAAGSPKDAKLMPLADIEATAKATGKSIEEVKAAARAKGFKVP